MNYKDDFKLLSEVIYLDNAATTLKPKSVIESVSDYYENYSANAHRGDYDISHKVDEKIDETRELVSKFIGADKNEIVFTSGTTEGLNMILKGYFKDYLSSGDEILTTKAEHASLLLPIFDIAKEKNLKVSYINLEDDMSVTLEEVKKAITDNTKLIALSHITNVIADIRPIKEITKYAHERGILVLVDGAQSVPHMQVDVKDLDVDFMCFSAHKMLGPTGVGVIYGKYDLLNNMKPIITGGGMNASFDSLMNVDFKDAPEKFEAGTPNIAGIIGFIDAIKYLNNIGMENVHNTEIELKKYLVDELSKLDNIIIYNKDIKTGVVTFNVEGVFAQDVAAYLNKKGICVRVGTHCAKALSEVLGVKNTIRVSLYFYNTKDDVDKLVSALKNDNILYESL